MDEKVTGKRFLAVPLLNVLITIVEILGGILSGSLALLSDAFHNLGDSLSIVLAILPSILGDSQRIGNELMATGELKSSQH